MLEEKPKSKKRLIVTIVSFVVFVPGGAYLLRDYGYMGSGLGTIIWASIYLWYFIRKAPLADETGGRP